MLIEDAETENMDLIVDSLVTDTISDVLQSQNEEKTELNLLEINNDELELNEISELTDIPELNNEDLNNILNLDNENNQDNQNNEDEINDIPDIEDEDCRELDEKIRALINAGATEYREFLDDDVSDFKVLNSDCSLSDISVSTKNSDILKYVNINEFPVQLNMIETLDMTLDNYLDNSINNKIPPTEWKSILFQICFGLAVAQKHFLFVHNDLHSSNIMFKNTELQHLYFKYKNKFFKIPTYNKVTKIIDFGRATFKLGNKIFFSDVFKKNEDAFGQYSYPFNNNSLRNCRIKPNMSFDLSRFATTIIERFNNYDEEYDEVRDLLQLWMTDKFGNDLSELDEDFDLYKIIARNVKSAHPKQQLNKKLWNEFEVNEDDIPSDVFVYKY